MISGATTSQVTRDEFMQLLLAQVQHQDPLEPLPQHEFLGQLAQFSTLDGIEQLNSSFEDMLSFQESLARLDQLLQGSNLVGRNINFTQEVKPLSEDTAGGDRRTVSGVVDAVEVSNGKLQLRVGTNTVSIDDVLSVGAPLAGT